MGDVGYIHRDQLLVGYCDGLLASTEATHDIVWDETFGQARVSGQEGNILWHVDYVCFNEVVYVAWVPARCGQLAWLWPFCNKYL